MTDILNSILLGILIVAPVGPHTIFCINNTISKGKLSGLISGLGASSADFTWALVVIFGMSSIVSIIDDYQNIFIIISTLILLVIGYSTYRAKISYEHSKTNSSRSFITDYFTNFSTIITNPVTIILFTSLLPSYGLIPKEYSITLGLGNAIGLLIGEILWWLVLIFIVSKLKNQIRERHQNRINKYAGIVIIIFALANLFRIF